MLLQKVKKVLFRLLTGYRMEASEYSALILCAGRSSRMGSFKPLLPLGGETLVERIIRLFLAAGISDVSVVLGHEARSIIPVLERHEVRVVINERYDEGMFSSVRAGVRQIDRKRRAFFLMPADIPLVRPATLRALMDAFRSRDADVCRPCFRGSHGHPPLISSELIPAVMSFSEPGGLRAFLASYGGRIVDVAVEDPGILKDLDTCEDYMAVLKTLGDCPVDVDPDSA